MQLIATRECSSRLSRLAQVYRFVAEWASRHSLAAPDSRIVSIEDSKGMLTVTWAEPPGEWERAVFRRAWEEAGQEPGCNVEHVLFAEAQP